MNSKIAHGTFNLWGNLAFYPSSGVVAQDRFFFYKTLLTNYTRLNNPSYRDYANQLGNAAKNILSSNPFTMPDESGSNRMIEHLQNALQILEIGIQYEYENEKIYIQEKLNEYTKCFENSDINTPEATTIKSCLESLESNGGINYNSLINLINILFSGLDNTLALYNHEKSHIESINEQYQTAKRNFLSQVNGTAKRDKLQGTETEKRITRAEKKFDKQAMKAYVEHHTFNIEKPKNAAERFLNAHMRNAKKAAGVIIGKKITDFLKVLLNSQIADDLRNIIEKNQLTHEGYRASEMQIRSLIIQHVTDYFNAHTAEFLSDEELDFPKIANEIVKTILDKSSQSLKFSIRGLYSNFGQYGHTAEFFKTNLSEENALVASASGLYDALLLFIQQIEKVKVSDLTEDQKFVRKSFSLQKRNGEYNQLLKFIRQLEAFNEQVKKINRTKKIPKKGLPTLNLGENISLTVTQNESGQFVIQGLEQLKQLQLITGADFLNFQTFNPQTLNSALATIKGRMSKKIKETLIEILREATEKHMREDVEKQLYNNLNGLIISVGGPTNDEIKQQLAENISFETLWSGKLNIKSDNITIKITKAKEFDFKLEFKPNLEQINPLIEEYYKEYQREYMDQVEQNMQQIARDRAFTDYDRLAAEFFNAQEQRDEFLKKIQQQLEEAEAKLNETNNSKKTQEKLQAQIEAQKAFLEELKSSLYISSTTKTFNNYQNDIGFVGGSIGSGIVNQINNLNTLFSHAGMPLTQSEIDWLIFAAINCSPISVIGTKQMGPIEQILGALSVFALFDEGGAELQILEKMLHFTPVRNSKIMHLYVMNGLYYPGSFVLQQAYTNIQYILNEVEDLANDNTFRNGVKLTSNVNFDMLPNKGGLTNTNPWGTVSEAAIQATSLHVTFLAGLLSVIDGVMNQLEEIEIPK